MKHPFLIFLIGCLTIGMGSMTVLASDECLNCHQDPSLKVTNPKLHAYYEDFRNSVHGVAELACSDCHGGDPASTDPATAHTGILEPVSYGRIPDTCGNCHAPQHEKFVTSKHYELLADQGTAPNCVTCHGAMDMDFIFVTRVKNTCAFCHNLETGTMPAIPDRADYVLNKINIMKGYRNFVNTYAKDKVRAEELNTNYDDLVSRWHRFDLTEIEADTKTLLGEFRQAKAQAMRDRREK